MNNIHLGSWYIKSTYYKMFLTLSFEVYPAEKLHSLRLPFAASRELIIVPVGTMGHFSP